MKQKFFNGQISMQAIALCSSHNCSYIQTVCSTFLETYHHLEVTIRGAAGGRTTDTIWCLEAHL
jgi:hypothetical protein